MRKAIITAIAAIAFAACAQQPASSPFCKVEDARIVLNGVPQYYIGTNVWYASRLAVENPERLVRELDTLSALGIKNLRILGTDENFEGLDKTLSLMDERGMKAVIFLNNAWEWTEDGYRKYMEDAGAGRQPLPSVDGYGAYMNAMSGFATNEKAVALYHEHVRRMVERYKDSPAIFSWQICNEPRPFSDDPAVKKAFGDYIWSTAALIKSIDSNHMVSTGNEGSMGCQEDLGLCESINRCPDIDYVTIHIWPYNWSWVKEDSVESGVDAAIEKTASYIGNHIQICRKLRKPLVVEEFGYPRDGFSYENTSATTGRDKYYEFLFGKVLKSCGEAGLIAGVNFWAWSGFAGQTPGHQFWQEGDDLCGDPFQEAQGLNGVYLTDSTTMALISSSCRDLAKKISIWGDKPGQWLHTGNGSHIIDVALAAATPIDVELHLDIVRDTTLMKETQDTVLSLCKAASVNGKTVLSYELKGLEPGFYQVRMSLKKVGHKCDAKPCGSFFVGTDPEKISSPQSKPEDFDAFWDSTLQELSGVPMNVTLTEMPEYSNDKRTTYLVHYRSLGNELVGGVLCKPNKPGKYRTFIDYMGYSTHEQYYDPNSAPDCVEFQASIRGQGVVHDEKGNWIDRGLGDKMNYYYRGAFCDAVRAIDYVCSLPEVDQDHLFARGESQGGALTWISASLDHRVDGIAPAVPFLSDYPDYGKIVWWPVWEVYQHAEAAGMSREEALDMMRYFDVKNFTDRVECPVLMAFGLQDPTCPPHTNFAGWAQVPGQKEYYAVPTCDHSMWLEESWAQKRAEFFNNL